MASSLDAPSAPHVALDLTARVAAFGSAGLTSVAYLRGYLYVTYMVRDLL